MTSLKELNRYVSVNVLPEAAISDDVLGRFHVVIVAGGVPRTEQIRWNYFCRENGIAYISGDVMGAAGYAFSDFGPVHTIKDKDGENYRPAVVVGVSKGKTTVIHTHDGARHGFEEGSFVVFREIDGPVQLNCGHPRRVVSAKMYSFEIDEDSTGWPDYLSGGVAEPVKVPAATTYASLNFRVNQIHPSDAETPFPADLGKFGRTEQLHVAFQAVELYRSRRGALPAVRDKAAADEVVAIAREWLESIKGKRGVAVIDPADLDADVVARVAMLARTELPALCAFYGGILAQEVVKVSGKFSPMRQWLYLDAFEVMPDVVPAPGVAVPVPEAEFAPMGTRYDDIIAIVGRTVHEKTMNQKVFVVGAGALGCEFLKNFALMGVGCGPRGSITITDMDTIEVSNLNRQFLFRANNVGQHKSVTAAAAARVMNPDMKVEAMTTTVGPETESVFDDVFWSNIDIVVNALDNVKARTYVDSRCVLYSKPLLESGTQGLKSNTQVILPFLTQTYADSKDQEDEAIPMCTLRNFPHLPEHCIEWARDMFQGAFVNSVQETSAFLKDPAAWLAKTDAEGTQSARREAVTSVLACLETARTASFEGCVRIAREFFHNQFYTRILQLLATFPLDQKDDKGVPFWSGPKRAPTPAVFDPKNTLHYEFIVHATALVAANYGVELPPRWTDPATLVPVLEGITFPPFVPSTSVRIKAGENDKTEEGADDDVPVYRAGAAKLSALAGTLDAATMKQYRLTPLEFEKDDDSNHHIAFITTASNLRSVNYAVKESTFHQVKIIAGRIIPAVATTTCSVTGCVSLELHKVVAGKPIEAFRNFNGNIAINHYVLSEPAGPLRRKAEYFDEFGQAVRSYPPRFSRWDKIVVKGSRDMTFGQLTDMLKAEHKMDVDTVTSLDNVILYCPLQFASHRTKRVHEKVYDRFVQDLGKALPPTSTFILLAVAALSTDDQTTLAVPPIKFIFA